MWNDGDSSFREDGGFDNTNMFSSPSGTQAKASKPKCLANVTIKQIIQSSEDGLQIKDTEVQVVKVVGIVKLVDITSVKIRYIIQDHTGSIVGYVYLDNDADTTSTVVENTYCIAVGSIRSQGGSKHIMIFNISPLQDFNYVLKHMLTVMYMPLKIESISNGAGEKEIKQEMMSSYGGTSSNANSDIGYDVDPKYKRIFDVISKSMCENGMSVGEIQGALPTKVPVDQIKTALEYLTGEGHIFTTIDENHYKSIHSAY